MIADALRVEIENHVARVRMRNPLLRRAAAGKIGPAAVRRYLNTLRYLIANTPPNLARARDLSRDTGRDALADYYHEKLLEEDGHERWAEDDLRVLGRIHESHASEPVPEAIVLNEFLRATIERDAMLYLAYVLWAEYFVALSGGELMHHLVERCHLPPETLTCLAKHVELDERHAEENLDALDALVEEPHMLESLRRTLRTCMRLFDQICEQIVAAEEAEIDRSAQLAAS